MSFTCFRCTSAHDKSSEYGSFLFMHEFFLRNLKDSDENDKENEMVYYITEKDDSLFQKWIQQKRNEYGETQKANKELYMSLFLCKECFGFHNVDIILLGKKYSRLYNLIEHVQLTDSETLQIQDVCRKMQFICKSFLQSIDIMFFCLYLIKENNIEIESNNYSLELFNKWFERIKSKIGIQINAVHNKHITKSIHKMFAFLVFHFCFQFYFPIFARITVEDVERKLLCSLYAECTLILSVEIYDNAQHMENKKKTNFIKKRQGSDNRKKQKVINSEEGVERNMEKRISNVEVYVSLCHVCICGHYNKVNKQISQTEWLTDSKNPSVLSVEECILNIFKKVFYFSSSVFMGAGREDKDVRMMGLGRPFVFVLKETRFSFLYFYLFFCKLKYIEESSIFNNTSFMSTNLKELFDNTTFPLCPLFLDKNILKEEAKAQPEKIVREDSNDVFTLLDRGDSVLVWNTENNGIKIKESTENVFTKRKIANVIELSCSYNKEMEELLMDRTTEEHKDGTFSDDQRMNSRKKDADIITHLHDFIEVNLKDLILITDYSLTKLIMKCGEGRKKSYKCLIYHSEPRNEKEIQRINEDIKNYQKNESYVLSIFQKTPLRVLHRRGLINRQRLIYKLDLVYIHAHFCLLYLTTQSGMYIKEFINGDRGRTFPNIKYFFNDEFVNILNLDVSTIEHD